MKCDSERRLRRDGNCTMYNGCPTPGATSKSTQAINHYTGHKNVLRGQICRQLRLESYLHTNTHVLLASRTYSNETSHDVLTSFGQRDGRLIASKDLDIGGRRVMTIIKLSLLQHRMHQERMNLP